MGYKRKRKAQQLHLREKDPQNKKRRGKGPPKENVWRTTQFDNEKLRKFYGPECQNILQTQEEIEAYIKAMRAHLPISFRFTGSRAQADRLRGVFEDKYLPALEDAASLEDLNPMSNEEELERRKKLKAAREAAWEAERACVDGALAVPNGKDSEDHAKDDNVNNKEENAADSETDGGRGENPRGDDEEVRAPSYLEWYPGKLAWTVNIRRRDIKKDPRWLQFKKFLVSNTTRGYISRQEVVSMIPPLVLDVHPHHRVLDMCAAPGSKSAQLIEALHAEGDEWTKISGGCMLANDADAKRSYMLVHQIKRLQSPCFLVTNHDATIMPTPLVTDASGKARKMLFDRILADVPCTGDGTLRKNVGIWRSWSPKSGIDLHPLQLQILIRGVQMLAVGGKLCYSTCSLNPIEDEAVLAALLRKFEGCVELVDLHQEEQLPGLIRRKGISSWKVMDKEGNVYSNRDEVPVEKLYITRPLSDTMWAPSLEEAREMHLDRSMRVLPQDNNTGGFFVAVLQKVKPLTKLDRLIERSNDASATEKSDKTEEVDEDAVEEGQDDRDMTRSKRNKEERTRQRKNKEAPFYFMEKDNKEILAAKKYFGISEDFPFENLLMRSKDGKKSAIYIVSDSVKQLLQNSEDRLFIVNAGTKVFMKAESPNLDFPYRISQEGLAYLAPFLSKKMVDISRQDLIKVLEEENPLFTELSPQLAKSMEQWPVGNVIFVYRPKKDEPQLAGSGTLYTSAFRARASVRLYVPKEEKANLLTLLTGIGEALLVNTASNEK
eukprot:Clim_evm52s235 gene=Clim_evmTU52s235